MAASPATQARRPVWMLVLLIVALVIGLANIAAYIYGLTLPDAWSARSEIVIEASPEEVYPYVATVRKWPEWSAWSTRNDPSLRLAYDGPETGSGASFSWLGGQLGRGTITITEVIPDRSIRYELSLQGQTFSKNPRIALEPVDDGTRVMWTDDGRVQGTLGRYFRERLEQSVADEFATSLQRLKSVVEESSSSGD